MIKQFVSHKTGWLNKLGNCDYVIKTYLLHEKLICFERYFHEALFKIHTKGVNSLKEIINKWNFGMQLIQYKIYGTSDF